MPASRNGSMKGAIVEAPGQLRVRDLPLPPVGPYDVLCEQLYGGVCAATDQHLIRGDLPIPNITYPLILGHESIGRVVERGAKVRHFQVGDLIARTGAPDLDGCKATWGGFVEYGLARDHRAMADDGLPQAEWSPFEINQVLAGVTDAAAATMMITWRETWSYLDRLWTTPASRVLVIGSGGNGFSFAVLAKARGAAMVAMTGAPRWADLAARAGVDAYADYHDPAAAEHLRAASPEGYDLIIDAVGKTGGLETVVGLLAPGGGVGLYGIEALGERMAYLARLRETGVRAHGPGEYREAEAHDPVLALFRDGRLDAGLWFDTATAPPLDRIGDAIAQVAGKRSLKAVVRIRG
jgi:2-desacetyl-2-hydroxyethyl bacteriochlorophyllide A dehydrogenase